MLNQFMPDMLMALALLATIVYNYLESDDEDDDGF
jgi:hypothetical protein